MDRLNETIADVAYILDSLINLRDIYATGDCNNCKNKDCGYMPKVGERVRYNCPFYNKGQNVRDCYSCKWSKDGHIAGSEECHECMWKNRWEGRMFEIAIKLDENVYTRLFDNGVEMSEADITAIQMAIREGTVLEPHGRLVDIDALECEPYLVSKGNGMYEEVKGYFNIDDAQTILDATE